MTAGKAGKLAAEGFWVTTKRIRDQWVLLVFLATTLFWARDFYETLIDLPVRVEQQHKAIEKVHLAIERLERRSVATKTNRSPVLVFPGSEHDIEDGQPGEIVVARLIPTDWLRDDCVMTEMAAFMVDSQGKWFSTDTTLTRLPQLVGSQNLAFGVRVDPAMAVGRAEFAIEFTQNCGSHVQVDSSPRLLFRVLPD